MLIVDAERLRRARERRKSCHSSSSSSEISCFTNGMLHGTLLGGRESTAF